MRKVELLRPWGLHPRFFVCLFVRSFVRSFFRLFVCLFVFVFVFVFCFCFFFCLMYYKFTVFLYPNYQHVSHTSALMFMDMATLAY